jgi:hypothetical protein
MVYSLPYVIVLPHFLHGYCTIISVEWIFFGELLPITLKYLSSLRIYDMTQIVSNIIQNSLSGFVAGAASTVGEYAGGAIAGLGNFVEQKGDAVGDGTYK